MNKSVYILLLTVLAACNTVNKNVEEDGGINKSKASPASDINTSSLVLDSTVISDFNGDTTAQINKTLQLVANFDKAAVNFASDTFNVYDQTTEGGAIIVVHNSTTDYLKFYGTLYGEMGKKEFSFYILNSSHPKLSFVSYTDIAYDKPIYKKDSKIRGGKTSYEIYCDNKLIVTLNEQKKKQTCSLVELVEKQRNTQSFFKDYIGQTKFLK